MSDIFGSVVKIIFTGQLRKDTLTVVTDCINIKHTYDTDTKETTCSFSFVLNDLYEVTPESYDIVSTAEVSFLDKNNKRTTFKFKDVRNHKGFLIALDEIFEIGRKYTFTSSGYTLEI